MSKKLEKISDKAIHGEVHHTLCRATEEFYRLSINIPKALLEVTQHIHGRFENNLSNINLQINKNKTYIQNIKYRIPYLGIKIYPYYMILDKQRIKRIYAGISSFITAEQTYPRVASRQGMFERYHGYKIMRSWYNKFPAYASLKIASF